jgi:hypothetical protein
MNERTRELVKQIGSSPETALASPDDPWSSLVPVGERAAAQLFIDLQDEARASGLIEGTLAKNPEYVPALMARADAAGKNDPKAAMQGYEEVLKIYPKFAPASEAIARIRAAESQQ